MFIAVIGVEWCIIRSSVLLMWSLKHSHCSGTYDHVIIRHFVVFLVTQFSSFDWSFRSKMTKESSLILSEDKQKHLRWLSFSQCLCGAKQRAYSGFSIEGGTRRLIAAYFGIYSRLLCV